MERIIVSELALSPYWSAYFDQANNAQDRTIVYRGCLGCLTDDCEKWESGECKDWVPCIIGRKLTR